MGGCGSPSGKVSWLTSLLKKCDLFLMHGENSSPFTFSGLVECQRNTLPMCVFGSFFFFGLYFCFFLLILSPFSAFMVWFPHSVWTSPVGASLCLGLQSGSASSGDSKMRYFGLVSVGHHLSVSEPSSQEVRWVRQSLTG